MAKDPVNKVAQGIGPHLKAVPEVVFGISTYPDVFNPQAIPRDDAIANLFALRDPYKAIKGIVRQDGTRARRNYWESLFGMGTVDPRREVLSEIYALRERFLINKGKPSVNILRSSDFSPMREAAYAGNYEAFKEARNAYRAKGKTVADFAESLDYLDPISQRLNDDDEKEFEQRFLNSFQRRRLKLARDYADQVRATLLSWWWKAAEESGSPMESEETATFIEERQEALRKGLKRPRRESGESQSDWERRLESSEKRRERAERGLKELSTTGN